MTEKLEELLSQARKIEMTIPEWREHRRSFVFGNTNIENDRVTRDIVEEADLKHESQKKDQ